MTGVRAKGIAVCCLFAVSFALWWGGMSINKVQSRNLFQHDGIDQHTRQATAWLQGRTDLEEHPSNLEIGEYKGKYYNSFPPTPTFVELLFRPIFGTNTPSSFLLFLFCFVTIVLSYRFFLREGFTIIQSASVSLGMIYGSNVFCSMVNASIWAQGQVYGFCLASFGFFFLHAARDGCTRKPLLAYFFLALAVGCRPFYVFVFFFFMAYQHWVLKSAWTQVAKNVVIGAFPYFTFLAVYNWIRFDVPWEFGHRYLPWSEKLEHGVFSLHYVTRNAYSAFLNLPVWDRTTGKLIFNGRGTAFWINNLIFAISILGLFFGKWEKRVKIVCLGSLALIWFSLLLHESNGWFQFGYRYGIDLFVFGWIGLMLVSSRLRKWIPLVVVVSILINLYGIHWFRAELSSG